MKKRLEHQKDLYKKLVMNESLYKETAALKTIFKDSIWWASETGEKISLLTTGGIKCPLPLKRRFGRHGCDKKLRYLINKAKKAKGAVRFDCGKNKFGICFPIIQGDKIYGYILVCNSKNEISDTASSLFSNFISTLIRELQKELELAKLYRTIRPRAIALSTIHTIHRIISSSLNPDELLPKLARLCLQVLRAEISCIVLKDPYKEPLVTSATSRNEKHKNASVINKMCVKSVAKGRVLSEGKIFMTKNKLCTPLTDEDIIGAICVMNKANKAPFDEFDKEILMTLSEQAAIAIKNARLYKEQENISIGSVKSLATVLNTRAPGTYRVKESFIKIVLAMGRKLHLNTHELRGLHYGAILHDAGQIAFPDELLVKTGKLTESDYDMIKMHPRKSVSIVKHLGFLKPVIPVILHHHENFNGGGYPKGLKGNQIPLGARIMAVAGAFNAMITRRPYRKKVSIKNAVTEIKKGSGAQFDPHIVETFMEVLKEDEIKNMLEREL